MPSPAGDRVDSAGGPVGSGECVDHRRLPHSGVSDQSCDPAGQQFAQLLHGSGRRRLCGVVCGDDGGQVQLLVVGDQPGWVMRVLSQVGFGDQQNRFDARFEGGHQGAVDEPGARFRVCRSHHDQQLVSIGHHHPFCLISVIGRAAQQRGPLLDEHQPGQGAFGSGGVADQPDQISGDHRGPAQGLGPHGDHCRMRGAGIDH